MVFEADDGEDEGGEADGEGGAAQPDVELRERHCAAEEDDGVVVALGEHGLAAFECDDGEDEECGEEDAFEAEEDAVDAEASAAAAGAADDVAEELCGVGEGGVVGGLGG